MKKITLILSMMLLSSPCLAQGFGSLFADRASKLRADTSNFGNKLSASDTTVQSALESLAWDTSGGSLTEDSVGTTELDDGSDTPTTGECVKVGSDTSEFDYGSCAIGAGDVSSVGDCADGSCLDGTSDGGTYIGLYDGDSHFASFATANLSANRNYTFGNLDLTFDQSVAASAAPTFTADNFSDGGSNAIITTTQETNFETAYTHSQDNTQAHSDYLLNSGNDSTSGDLTIGGGEIILGSITQDGTLVIHDDDAGGDATVTIQAADATGTSYTLTLPPDDGDAGEQLQTNGSGVLTWEAAGSGGGSTQYAPITIENPIDADDLIFYRFNDAATVSTIECIVEDATSAVVVFIECDANGSNCGSANTRMEESITCAATMTSDDGTIGNAGIAAGGTLRAQVGTVTGDVGHVFGSVTFTND